MYTAIETIADACCHWCTCRAAAAGLARQLSAAQAHVAMAAETPADDSLHATTRRAHRFAAAQAAHADRGVAASRVQAALKCITRALQMHGE
ncbi:hypothetical protein GGF31_009012 [Allomyces arbusculus]|nr:hypothetical protein GGF31_009012 [Allomyces arbusculus]